LGGEAFTPAELAAEISRQSGREVAYTDMSEQEYVKFLVGACLPAPSAEIYADAAASRSALFVETTDLETLLGRPVTPLTGVIAGELQKLA
jgi:NAD(P)H dehydrogenase (quinone)